MVPIICDVCHKTFTEKKSLTRHMKQVHEKSTNHTCPQCSTVFTRNEHLSRHLSICNGEQPSTSNTQTEVYNRLYNIY